MKTKIAERCLDIVRRVVATGNPGGLGYVEEALRQVVDVNDMRVRLIKERYKLKS